MAKYGKIINNKMKTLHNTKNCNYRRYLHKKLKHGKISGRFYKFLCRNFPYRINAREVTICVSMVLDGRMTENKAIATLQGAETELRRQRELYNSNVECRKKISKTTTPCFRDSEKVCVGKLRKASKTTTPYTKSLLPKNYG